MTKKVEAEIAKIKTRKRWEAKIEELKEKRWTRTAIIAGTAFVLGMSAMAVIFNNVL